MSDHAIKPCPICGSEPETETSVFGSTVWCDHGQPHGMGTLQVTWNCGLLAPHRARKVSLRAAIKWWNKIGTLK